MATTPKPSQGGLEECGAHGRGKALSPSYPSTPGGQLPLRAWEWVGGSEPRGLKAWGSEVMVGTGCYAGRGLGNGCCWARVGGGDLVPSRGSWGSASGKRKPQSPGSKGRTACHDRYCDRNKESWNQDCKYLKWDLENDVELTCWKGSGGHFNSQWLHRGERKAAPFSLLSILHV